MRHVAVCVCSQLDLSGTKRALREQGVSLQDLAFLVCNSGAEIWAVRSLQDAAAAAEPAAPEGGSIADSVMGSMDVEPPSTPKVRPKSGGRTQRAHLSVLTERDAAA